MIGAAFVDGLFGVAQQYNQNEFAKAEAEKNRIFQSAEADKNRQFQAQEAERAFEREQEYYDKNLSFSAQVKQMQEAGLNPAMMYGGNTTGGGTPPASAAPSGSMPSGSAASSSPMGIVSLFEKMLDLKQKKANVDKTEEETKEVKQNVQTSIAQAALYNANSEQAKAAAKELSTRERIEVERWNKESEKIDEEIESIKSNKELTDQQKATEIQRTAEMEALASYNKWKSDNAALHYWIETGMKGIRMVLDGTGMVFNYKRFKEIMRNKIPRPQNRNDQRGYDEFFNELDSWENSNSLDLDLP